MLTQRLALPASEQGSQVGQQAGHPGPQPRRSRRSRPSGHGGSADQPPHGPVEQTPGLQVDRGLRGDRDPSSRSAHRRPQVAAARTVPHDHVRPQHVGRRRRRSPPGARYTNDVPPRLTTSLTTAVATISRRSRCRAIRLGNRSAQRGREVVHQHVAGPRLVGQVRSRRSRRSQQVFSYAMQDRDLRGGERVRAGAGLELLVAWAAPPAPGRAGPDSSNSVIIRRCTGTAHRPGPGPAPARRPARSCRAGPARPTSSVISTSSASRSAGRASRGDRPRAGS